MNADQGGDWDQIRNDLANSQAWYAIKGNFAVGINDYSLDALIYQRLQPLEAAGALPYCPYLFESLIADMARDVDNCLAYRREIYELCTQGTRRALDYQYFLDTVDSEEAFAILNTSADQANQEAEFYQSSSRKFEGNGGIKPAEHLVAGLNEISKGCATVRSGVATRELSKQQQIKAKYKFLRSFQKSLERFHQSDGSSLNYLQRVDRLTQLLLEDLSEAYQKAMSAIVGMEWALTFHPSIELPKVTPTGYLDAFTLWLRQVMRKLELYVQDEMIGSRWFSLRQLAKDANDWDTQLRNNKLTFIYPGPWDGYRQERVDSVGVGLVKYKGSPGGSDFAAVALQIHIEAPMQHDRYSGKPVWASDALAEYFSHVTLLDKDAMAVRGVPSSSLDGGTGGGRGAFPLRNIRPNGTWTVRVVSQLAANQPLPPHPPIPVELMPDDIIVEIRTRCPQF